MQEIKVTLIVVPRERFSYTQKSLENIYQNTNLPFNLIYVDTNSPPQTKRYLEIQAQEKNFHLIRVNCFLSPNQARNLALKSVDTEYVVYIDNDVLVKPGWLKALVNCADETGAWVVGPLCFEGADFNTIHMAGGSFVFKQREKRQWLAMKRPYFKTPLAKIRTDFQRQPCDIVEFHCCLARMDVFKQLGPHDEQIINVGTEDDLCLTVLKAGNLIYFEPKSMVTYVSPTKLVFSDIPFFFTRWSQAWFTQSINRLQEKWNLVEDCPVIRGHQVFVKAQKYFVCPKPQKSLDYPGYIIKKAGLKLMEKIFNIKAFLMLSKTRKV